jgi:hypothetical protein
MVTVLVWLSWKKKTYSTEEFFLRKERQVYCDEGRGNFDVINYVVVVEGVVVEGNEGYNRCVVVVIFLVVEED